MDINPSFFYIKSIYAFLAVLFIASGTAWSRDPVDHRPYEYLLGKYVSDGRVDYQGIQREEDLLDQYLTIIENVDTDRLTKDGQFAFYINAYNAWTIKLVLSGYPGINSIKDLGTLFRGPWKKRICRINGKVLTLDEIEHEILRPRFNDSRVHFAINCAAKSCPPLISVPYREETLNRQLDESASAFINNPARNRIEDTTLYVSAIFKWFRSDFNNDIAGFVLRYAQGDLKVRLETVGDRVRIEHLDYDWSLNDK